MDLKTRMMTEYIEEAFDAKEREHMIHWMLEGMGNFTRLNIIAEELDWFGIGMLEEVKKKADELIKELGDGK